MVNLLKRTLLPRLLLLTLLVVISACSTLQQPSFNPESPSYLKAQGKLAITYKDTKHVSHSESGRFNWQQQQERFNWYIAGPFGLGWINLTGNGKQVILTSQNGASDKAPTAELLLQKHHLPNLPLSDLNWWLKGTPNPNKPFALLGDNNSGIPSFTQSTATISYLEAFTTGNHPNAAGSQKRLPKKIVISLPEGQVKLFISHWQQGGNP